MLYRHLLVVLISVLSVYSVIILKCSVPYLYTLYNIFGTF